MGCGQIGGTMCTPVGECGRDADEDGARPGGVR
jgi:hypothetical protein